MFFPLMIYNARSSEKEIREVENMSTDRYVSPLSERYASKEMQYIFSPDMKFRTWRKLWIALAETEKELGLNITQEQIDELKAHAEDINYDVAKAREKEVRHDVMSMYMLTAYSARRLRESSIWARQAAM